MLTTPVVGSSAFCNYLPINMREDLYQLTITTNESADSKELIISIIGTFDFSCVQDFRDSYSGNVKYKKYSVDMAEVDHIDSSALGMLLNMKKTVGEVTPITIANCKPSIKKIFEISRFDKKFDFS